MPGQRIVLVNAVLTVVFTLTALAAVVFFEQPWKALAVTVCLVSFTVGVLAFLWGYWTAVQRSRTDNISVAALYFLVDNCAPRAISRQMNSLLAVQVVVAIATAVARSTTDGKAGSTLAFGVLVPMLGLGLNGLWGANHGSFGPRKQPDSTEVPDSGSSSRQDEEHD
jgi:hypothetical protein